MKLLLRSHVPQGTQTLIARAGLRLLIFVFGDVFRVVTHCCVLSAWGATPTKFGLQNVSDRGKYVEVFSFVRKKRQCLSCQKNSRSKDAARVHGTGAGQ